MTRWELRKVVDGAAEGVISLAWHTGNFSRAKTLKPLAHYTDQLRPKQMIDGAAAYKILAPSVSIDDMTAAWGA